MNSSHATYTFLVIGPDTFAAGAALNSSIINDDQLTTESGTQFRLYSTFEHDNNSNTTAITLTSCDDNEILLAIFITAIIIACLVIGGLLGTL